MELTQHTTVLSASGDELLRLPALACRIVLRMTSAARVPRFKSSTVRGALGHALKRDVCSHPERSTCEGCPLLDECHYLWLFEGHTHRPCPWYQQNAVTPPFRILVADESRDLLPVDSGLELRLIVFGDAIAHLGLFLRALDRVGREFGVGQEHLHGGGRFVRLLVEDETTGDALCVGDTVPDTLPVRPLSAQLPPLGNTGRRRLLLNTPLQYKRNGRDWLDPDTQPGLHELLTSLQHRLYLLNWHYNRDFAAAPPEPIRTASPLLAHSLAWRILNRYSNRDATHKPISGMTGWLLYDQVDSRWDSLLSAASWTGLGRLTVMGLGDLKVCER